MKEAIGYICVSSEEQADSGLGWNRNASASPPIAP
jgi:hypothetical protein